MSIGRPGFLRDLGEAANNLAMSLVTPFWALVAARNYHFFAPFPSLLRGADIILESVDS